ncbi:MAG: fibronectin type III domain-containing protein [Patescibacteria group bacterium]
MTRFTSILIIVLFTAALVASAAWLVRSPRVDATGKILASLYEGASDTWDAQIQVLPFERAPDRQLTLRWQPPEETYNHFVVTISKADGTLVRKESGEHDRVTLDLDALEPETEYVFALQACLDRRCEQWLVAQEEYRGTTQQ